MRIRIVSDGMSHTTEVMVIDNDGRTHRLDGVSGVCWSVQAGGQAQAMLMVNGVSVDVVAEETAVQPAKAT